MNLRSDFSMTIERQQRYRSGLRAEALAGWVLRLKGYRIVAQRVKTPVGEIDLIARRGETLVFVEVKARGTIDDALFSVQSRQSQRIIRAAEYYLSGQRGTNGNIRFDVIAVQPPFRIRHIRSAFTK